MNSDGKTGPPTKPLASLTREGEHLRQEGRDDQAEPEGSHAVEHGRELVAAAEHGQRQGHPDDPEEQSAEHGLDDPGRLQPAHQELCPLHEHREHGRDQGPEEAECDPRGQLQSLNSKEGTL